ncbi:MAG: hypothetical protein WAY93_03320 [Atopobiaceae bacterium]
MPPSRSRRDRTLLLVAIALFVAFSMLRICLATFPKSINVKPDELRYLDLARSLFNGGLLVIRGVQSDFQKILYPLSLFPALLFDDTVMQVRAIGVLSSLYVCSSVFPAMLLAKRLFKGTWVVVACMVLVLAMPDMCYSMTFMSESLYLPVALWLVVVLWKALTATGEARFAWSSAGGVLCYAAYLCKEVALSFAIAFVLVYAIMALRGAEGRRTCLLAVACFLLAFGIPFAIMKITLFRGLLDSYDMASPDILLNPYTLLFSVYALANQATHLIVGFAFFPIFFVAFTARDLSRDDRRLFLLCLVALVVGLLTVVYTISIREEVGHEALRPQLRYVSVLFVPLLFLFVKQVGQADVASILASPRRCALLVGVTTAVVMLVVMMFGAANLRQGFDNSQYHALRWLYSLFDKMDAQSWVTVKDGFAPAGTDEATTLVITPGIWLSRLLVVLFVAGGTVGLLGRHRVGAGVAIVAVVAVVMVANNVANCQLNERLYSWDEGSVEQASAIDAYLSRLPDDARVLIVTDASNPMPDLLADTYIDDRRLTQLSVKASALPEVLGDASWPSVDYILVKTGQKVVFDSDDVELVDMGDGSLFRLYHVVVDRPRLLSQG